MKPHWQIGIGAGLALAPLVLAVPLFSIGGGGSEALPAALSVQPSGCNSCNARHQHLTRLAPSTSKELSP